MLTRSLYFWCQTGVGFGGWLENRNRSQGAWEVQAAKANCSTASPHTLPEMSNLRDRFRDKFMSVILLPGIKRQNFPNDIESDKKKSNSLMEAFRCTNMALRMPDSGFLQFL